MNMWQSGSIQSPIGAAQLARIKSSAKDEEYTDIAQVGGYITKWYIPENEIVGRLMSRPHILSMDTSEAGGNDDISLVILDIRSLEVVACGVYNETNLLTMAEWVFSWFKKYPKLVGIIERRSTGQFLMDVLSKYMLANGMNPFRRLFNTIVNNQDENPDKFTEISKTSVSEHLVSKYKTAFGYATAGSGMMSRNELYSSSLQLAAKNAADVVNDRGLIDQISTLIIKNGRIDHQDGNHDDLVIGWLLAVWFLSKGKNMGFYGIDSKEIMSEINTPSSLSAEDLMDITEQKIYRNQIKDIVAKMQNETDDFIISNYERALRALNSRLIMRDGEHFSIDALLSDLKDSRRQKLQTTSKDTNYNKKRSTDLFEAMYSGVYNGNVILSR